MTDELRHEIEDAGITSIENAAQIRSQENFSYIKEICTSKKRDAFTGFLKHPKGAPRQTVSPAGGGAQKREIQAKIALEQVEKQLNSSTLNSSIIIPSLSPYRDLYIEPTPNACSMQLEKVHPERGFNGMR